MLNRQQPLAHDTLLHNRLKFIIKKPDLVRLSAAEIVDKVFGYGRRVGEGQILRHSYGFTSHGIWPPPEKVASAFSQNIHRNLFIRCASKKFKRVPDDIRVVCAAHATVGSNYD